MEKRNGIAGLWMAVVMVVMMQERGFLCVPTYVIPVGRRVQKRMKKSPS